RRVCEGNWRALLQWLAIRRAELANLPHVQPFPEPNQMPMKRSLPKAETNVLQFPQTAPGRGHARKESSQASLPAKAPEFQTVPAPTDALPTAASVAEMREPVFRSGTRAV